MFERRLKVLLSVLAGFTLVLLLRAGWLQIVEGSDLQRRAIEGARRPSPLETFRGAILDYKGRVLAIDAPCIDAAVDYRAIDVELKESQEWLRAQAKARLNSRGVLKGDKDDRTRLIDDEVAHIKSDLQIMWAKMAQISGKTSEEIDEIKQLIIHRVRLRKRYIWYKRFQDAKEKHDNEHREPPAGWYRWLVDDSEAGPQIDDFKVNVAEQSETHPILHAIDNDAYIVLDKLRERCPGLELKKGTRRNYPYNDIGCHVIGNLAPVKLEDLKHDPYLLKDDAKRYWINDMIGRGGIERLAEPMLRGSRGSVIRQQGSETPSDVIPPIPGKDVKITIDMELQMRVQEAFLRYKELGDPVHPGRDLRVQQMQYHVMHGAAVVIDIPTGEVRALVSYPTYDLNEYAALYQKLNDDHINQPLLNRATQAALEPGSTVKPMVGISAITAGLMGVNDTIECTGFFMQNGVALKGGRCWTMSKFGYLGPALAGHHQLPSNAPHPTGFLTFADAIERSCNVFFENMGNRLGIAGLNHWMHEFGLGKLTEIGIAEIPGHVPGDSEKPMSNSRSTARFSGIGQSEVLATPIQMANVAATIARRGIWVRPHLLVSETPDVVHRDLHLDPAAVAAAHLGMINVVNAPAGTGRLERDDILVAGKTGTAQAARFNIPLFDEKGNYIRDEQGKVKHKFFDASTAEAPNPEMPWYRGSGSDGKELGHAWFIGFAPANDPKIAFAVMAEYGGSGGHDAGPFVQVILDACIDHGYLSKSAKAR
jgi:penicillin-binding protein 2